MSLRFLSGPALRDDPDFPCSVGRILWHTQTTRCIEQPNRTTSRIEGKVTGDCKRIKHEETEDWETKRRRRKGSITEGDGTDRGTAGDGAEVRGLEGLGGAGAPVEKQTGQGEPRHQQAEPQVPRQVRICRRRNLLATVAHLQAATVPSAAISFLRGRVCHRGGVGIPPPDRSVEWIVTRACRPSDRSLLLLLSSWMRDRLIKRASDVNSPSPLTPPPPPPIMVIFVESSITVDQNYMARHL